MHPHLYPYTRTRSEEEWEHLYGLARGARLIALDEENPNTAAVLKNLSTVCEALLTEVMRLRQELEELTRD